MGEPSMTTTGRPWPPNGYLCLAGGDTCPGHPSKWQTCLDRICGIRTDAGTCQLGPAHSGDHEPEVSGAVAPLDEADELARRGWPRTGLGRLTERQAGVMDHLRAKAAKREKR